VWEWNDWLLQRRTRFIGKKSVCNTSHILQLAISNSHPTPSLIQPSQTTGKPQPANPTHKYLQLLSLGARLMRFP
jgi:hypothetical protein